MIKRITVIFLCLLGFQMYSQEKPIKIVEERSANRIMLYAVNENLYDLDVMITVEGKNFRQSKGRPRAFRVPATSKVHLKNLIIERGKFPQYTYELDVTDSLSRRAIRKPATPVKIDPKKQITIYIPDNCVNCDSIVNPLDSSVYRYKRYVLSEEPTLKEQLSKAFIGRKPIDSMDTAIISLGGSLYTKMRTFEELMEELNKEEQ